MPEALPGHIGGMTETPDGVIIDNRTGLADDLVRDAVYAHWVETAAFQFGQPTTFQMWSNNDGSLLARQPFEVPKDIIAEIKLARQVADTDDDIRAAVGQMVSAAFRDGMQHQHTDEQAVGLFNEWAKDVNEDDLFKELYREFLITGQVNTLHLFTRKRYSFTPDGTEESVQAQVSVPLVGILPAESLRVVTTDLFGNGTMAYEVENATLRMWLDEFFDPRTSPARQSQMREQEPVVASVFTGRREIDWNDHDPTIAGKTLYTLNQRMLQRTTMPKGAAAYPRPILTSNFALLEAKRLLNVMDYALLQGGTNYIVVAKQGSDKLPAQQPEIDNLMGQVRMASRSGVMVGDHRLSIEIITPDLTSLLDPKKRQMVGQKITQALMRIPSQVTQDGGTEGIKAEMTLAENTITSDRRDLKRHMERIYDDIVSRNRSRFVKGAPSIWFPRIVLTDSKDFYDAVLKTRDRGDIPRKWSVEMLGFNFEAGVEQRKREKAQGLDELMVPGNVPFSDPNAGPQDLNQGREPGVSDGNGRNTPTPDAGTPRRRRVVNRTPGETVRAQWDGDVQRTIRIGTVTENVLAQYPEFSVGRVTQLERDAVEAREVAQNGPTAVVPVNLDYEVADLRVLRLDEGLSLLVGRRLMDDAMVAKAICFREPHWTIQQAEDTARRWGFETPERYAEEVAQLEPVAPPVDVEAILERQREQLQGTLEAFATQMAEAVRNIPAPVVTVQMPEAPAPAPPSPEPEP